jgi:hypothetical protein
MYRAERKEANQMGNVKFRQSIVRQRCAFIILSWHELVPLKDNGYRLWLTERKVYVPTEYPEELPCSNPECQGGGFDIGDRITNLLKSGQYSEQNSLICRNAIHQDRTKRCLHTILYSIAHIRPYYRRG